MTIVSARNGTPAHLRKDGAVLSELDKNKLPARAPQITTRQSSRPASLIPLIAAENTNVSASRTDAAQSTVSGKESRSAAPQSTSIATFQQAAAALQNQRRSAYPMISGLIDRSFVNRLFERTNLKVDPEHTWLDEFNRAILDKGWQFQGQPTRSTSLADLVRNGFPADIDWERIQMNARAGVFSYDAKTGSRKQLRIDTPVLKRVVDDMHPLPAFQLEQLREFWGKDSQAHEGVHQQSLLTSAHAWQASHRLHASGQLSDAGLAMIYQAAGFAEGQAGDMRAYALDIGGYRAEDIAILEKTDGRTVMVMPGDQVMFREFSDKNALRKSLLSMARDPASRARLASHFSLQDWRDSYKAGIGSLLEMMGARGAAANIPILQDRTEISGDVFDWTARRQGEARLAEAQTLLGANGTFDAATQHYLDRRGAQLFAEPMTVSSSIGPGISPAGNSWLSALNEALASDNPSWWAPKSAMKEPALAGLRALPAERQRDLAQRHFALDAAERELMALEPDLQASARKFMQDKLREHFQFTRDPDQFVLVEYEQDNSRITLPHTHVKPVRYANTKARRIHKITPLSQLPIDGIPYKIGDATQPNGRFVVRAAKDIPKRWTPGMRSLLPVRELAELVRNKQDFDFEAKMLKATDDFYQQHGSAKTVLAQQKALLTADIMRAEGKLSEQDYQLARSGFGFSPAADSPHGVPRARVSTHELDIGKRVSLDSLHIEDKFTKRSLLYLPGEETPIRAFDNRTAAVDWLMQMHADPASTDRFVADHFSVTNAKAGVLDLMHAPQRTNWLNQEQFLNGTADINKQPFAWLNQRQHAQLKIDLTQEINSPGDLQTNRWVDAMEKTPIPFIPAAAKAFKAPTLEQRRQGLKELGMEALIEVFTAGAAAAFAPAAKGISRVWKNMRRLANGVENGTSTLKPASIDRWFKPPQRVNGQIGYPMGPVEAPRLSSANSTPTTPDTPVSPIIPGSPGSPYHPGTRRGEVNKGFIHSDGDTTPQAASPFNAKEPAHASTGEEIALQDIGNAARRQQAAMARPHRLSQTTQTTQTPTAHHTSSATQTPSHIGTQTDIGVENRPSSSAQAIDVDHAARLAHAKKVLADHGQNLVPAPAWLKKPDWMTDQYMRDHRMVLPANAKTVDEMIEAQQKAYADLINLQGVKLAQAYESGMPYSEISVLTDMQKKAIAEKKNSILSQWAQVNATAPLATVDLNGIEGLHSCIPGFKQQGKRSIARLKQSKSKKQEEMSTFLSQHLSDNKAVQARQMELQKQLDAEVKLEVDGLNSAVQRFQSTSGIVLGVATVLGGGSGITAWIVREVNSKKTDDSNASHPDAADPPVPTKDNLAQPPLPP